MDIYTEREVVSALFSNLLKASLHKTCIKSCLLAFYDMYKLKETCSSESQIGQKTFKLDFNFGS